MSMLTCNYSKLLGTYDSNGMYTQDTKDKLLLSMQVIYK